MTIEELVAGKHIYVRISRENETADFETNIIERLNDCLVVEPILYEGQKVDFSAKTVNKAIQVLDETLGKLYEWRDVVIKSGTFKKTISCHLISMRGEPVEVNRRKHFRQYLGLPGMVMPVAGDNMSVDIKDVSNLGVGFVCDNKGQLEIGSQCIVVFVDEEYKFELNSTIVRERELPNGRYEFGCKVSKAPTKLPMYIAHKQMEKRRKLVTGR